MNPDQNKPGDEPVYQATQSPKAPMPEEPTAPPPADSSKAFTIVKKRGLSKALIGLIIFILALGGVAFATLRNRGPAPEPQEESAQHVFEEYPDFPGIPINEATVSFVKADGKFCLLYKGIVYLPQDSGVFVPKSMEETEEMSDFPWVGLVDAPTELASGADEVFSFKDSPSNNSFVFIMRWATPVGERYHMFRFFNNTFSELRVFTDADGLFYVPKLNLFSLGGNFLNLSLFRCADCLTEQSETQLYYIPTGDTRNIGKVSFFEWTEDDNVYRYKQFEEGTDPADVPLRTNEFFERSEELLNP